MQLSTIEHALGELRKGRPILVADDADRENEADIVMAAEHADERWMAWSIRHSSGVICAPMPDDVADRLRLPPMVSSNEDPKGTAYTVSVDARGGVHTGISAADRAHTVRLLADPSTSAEQLTRPGHVFPLRAKSGGVLQRRGHTEASVDLCRLAGLQPVAFIVELVHDDGRMMRLGDALEFAQDDDLAVITIEDLVTYRERFDRVERGSSAQLPTQFGDFEMRAYRDKVTGAEHLALVHERPLRDASTHSKDRPDLGTSHPGAPTLVRVHSECLTGDALGSARCDCGPQLRESQRLVAETGGVIIYLRGHEGRGVGLANKVAAYALQDQGFDTVDAQTELGLPVEAREYGAAVAILRDLGVKDVELLSNNPAKAEALIQGGIQVSRTRSLIVGLNAHNSSYVQTKGTRMGHVLPANAFSGLAVGGSAASVREYPNDEKPNSNTPNVIEQGESNVAAEYRRMPTYGGRS